MLRYIARRLAQAALIVAIVATITFALIHIAPGDPFSAVLDNPNVSETVRQTLRAQYGLDRPLPEQFVRYVGALAHGELGWSFSHDRPVLEVLGSALPNTRCSWCDRPRRPIHHAPTAHSAAPTSTTTTPAGDE